MEHITILTAFWAGVLSFLSPCVLPIIPGYISLITGFNTKQIIAGNNQKSIKKITLINTLFFILGFTLIFVLLQVVFHSFFLIIDKAILNYILGSIVILFGLHTTGIIRLKFLYYQKKMNLPNKNIGIIKAFVIGIVFGFAWTPCVGPILAGILALASTQETLLKGTVLLLIYSIGLGLPFLLTGFFMEIFLSFLAKIKKSLVVIEIISGALLIIIGIYIFTDNFNKLAVLLQ